MFTALRDIYLGFKALNKSGDGVVTREEFCRFYDVAHLKWKPVKTGGFQKTWPVFENVGVRVHRFLNSSAADILFSTFL